MALRQPAHGAAAPRAPAAARAAGRHGRTGAQDLPCSAARPAVRCVLCCALVFVPAPPTKPLPCLTSVSPIPQALCLAPLPLPLLPSAQVALGITTLLTYVPVPLGAAHQAGAMVLFTLMLSLLYSIKPAPSLGTFRWLGGWVGHGGHMVWRWEAAVPARATPTGFRC